MNLFKYIDFETVSVCNRKCPTCIRNSHPDRKKIESWFKVNYLPIDVIEMALDQCVDLGFTGGVCLSHYNEPLLDGRIVKIAEMVKSYDRFNPIFLVTNGDYLNKHIAGMLDGVLDSITVSLYMEEPMKSERAGWINSLFKKTTVNALTMSRHIPTHFSPNFDVEKLARRHKNRPCYEANIRVIINHRCEYLLCCDDVVGNFDLGTFPEISIEDFWFGSKRSKIAEDLNNNGGRLKYEYCKTCPRP